MQRRSKTTNKKGKFIRDFNDIREIARRIYLYGCFSKDDYINKYGLIRFKGGKSEGKNMARSAFENQIARLAFYLPSDFFDSLPENGLYSFNYDSADETDDILLDMYRYKTFQFSDIQTYLFVQQILADADEPMLFSDLQNEILEEYRLSSAESDFDEDRYLDPLGNNFRNKIDDLVSKGLIIKNAITPKKMSYELAPDILADFDEEDLEKLYNLLDFLAKSAPIQVPFHYAKRKLYLYLEQEREYEMDVLPFRYKNNMLAASLDNIVCFQLLQTIKKKSVIECSISPSSRQSGKILHRTFLPIAIVHDAWQGRQYCVGYDIKTKHVSSFRLDSVYSIEPSEKEYRNYDAVYERVRVFLKNSWCIAGKEGETIPVDITFQNKKYLRTRVMKEAENADITENSDTFTLHVNVSNPEEMIPWVRSFGENAVTDNPVINKQILKSFKNIADGKLARVKEKDMGGEPGYIGISSDSSSAIFDKFENIMFEALARIINQAWNDEGKISANKADSLIKKTMRRAVSKYEIDFEREKGFYGILSADKDNLHLKVNRFFPIRFTTLEKEAIVNALKSDKASYFMNPELIKQILKVVDMPDVSWDLSDIEIRNGATYNTKQSHKKIRENLSLSSEAIMYGYMIAGTNRTKQDLDRPTSIHPVYIEYVSRDDSFHLISYDESEHRLINIRLDRLAIDDTAEPEVMPEIDEEELQNVKANSVTIQISPAEFALERALRLFSGYERSITYDTKNNVYEMKLNYYDYDAPLIVRDLLSCGDFVKVTEGVLLNVVQERVTKAMIASEPYHQIDIRKEADSAGIDYE